EVHDQGDIRHREVLLQMRELLDHMAIELLVALRGEVSEQRLAPVRIDVEELEPHAGAILEVGGVRDPRPYRQRSAREAELDIELDTGAKQEGAGDEDAAEAHVARDTKGFEAKLGVLRGSRFAAAFRNEESTGKLCIDPLVAPVA